MWAGPFPRETYAMFVRILAVALLARAAGGSCGQPAALFVPKVAASPVVYAFCWIGETFFAPRPQKTKELQ